MAGNGSGGAPQGNNNAGKGREWTEAVRWALKHYESEDIKRGQALRKIAMSAIESALNGDTAARSEIANRLDGKPTEYRESVIRKTIEHIAVSATAAWLKQTLADEAAGTPAESRPN